MAEYIDRNAAIEWLEANKEVYKREGLILAADQDGIIEFLKKRPAADVAPVVHAHWELAIGSNPKRSFLCTGDDGCEMLSLEASPYCPNCGAKMDEEAP